MFHLFHKLCQGSTIEDGDRDRVGVEELAGLGLGDDAAGGARAGEVGADVECEEVEDGDVEEED